MLKPEQHHDKKINPNKYSEMKKTSLIVLIALILIRFDCISQNLIERLNSLPPTTIQRAPIFDIEKKFHFSFDSINNSLFVQAYARNPKTMEAHIYQDIFEISLSDLNAGSFLLLKKSENPPLFNLEIGTTNNKQGIICYLLIENQVEMVQVRDVLSLGSWAYTEQLNSQLNEIINLLTERIPEKSISTTFGTHKTLFKYYTDKIVTTNKEEPNKELNFGYYYVGSLEKPSFYNGKKNISISNSALIKDLKVELARLNGITTVPTPVVINVAKSGQIESVFYLDQADEVNRNIDLKNFQTFNPGEIGSQYVKSKTLLIIR